MERSGTKFKGFVVGYDYRYRELRGHSPISSYKEYFLKVKYMDYFGIEKTFETPALSFCPEEKNNVTCDVYVYQNDVLAANFNHLSKKKNNWEINRLERGSNFCYSNCYHHWRKNVFVLFVLLRFIAEKSGIAVFCL